MPLYVGYTQKRRKVKLLTAGDDIFKLLKSSVGEIGGQVDLQAIINDYTNTRNHTLTWEQLIGEVVILTSYDTFETSYIITELSDKTFRFYLDKGTNKEQYKDIDIFYTPTSRLSISPGSKGRSLYSHVTALNLEIQGEVIKLPENNVGRTVVFDPVASNAISLKLIGAIGEFTYNPTTVISEYLASEVNLPTSMFLAYGSYLIEVTYLINGVTKSFRSPLFFIFNSAGDPTPELTLISNFVTGGSNFGKNYNINKTIYSSFPENLVSELVTHSGGSKGRNYNISKITYSSLSPSAASELVSTLSISSSGGSNGRNYNIVRIDNSNVGA